MSKIDPIKDLKNTVLDFIGTLKDEILTRDQERGELLIVEMYFKNLHPERLMNHIIDKILPHTDKIKNKELIFFSKNKGALFAGLPADRISYYSDLIMNSNRLDDEDRDEIWEYLEVIVALAEVYKKRK